MHIYCFSPSLMSLHRTVHLHITGDFETMQYVFAQLEERMAVIDFDTQVAMDRGMLSLSPPLLLELIRVVNSFPFFHYH